MKEIYIFKHYPPSLPLPHSFSPGTFALHSHYNPLFGKTPGSAPGLSFSSRAFLLGTLVLPSLQMPTFPISNLIRNGRWKTTMWMCYLVNHVLMINK